MDFWQTYWVGLLTRGILVCSFIHQLRILVHIRSIVSAVWVTVWKQYYSWQILYVYSWNHGWALSSSKAVSGVEHLYGVGVILSSTSNFFPDLTAPAGQDWARFWCEMLCPRFGRKRMMLKKSLCDHSHLKRREDPSCAGTLCAEKAQIVLGEREN